VQHLLSRSVKSITVVNRGQERVRELQAQFPGANIIAATLDDMLARVGKSHVTFACTAAVEPILYKENLERVMQRAAMLVDISVPRNIDDESANTVPGIKAYNVDDLKAVVSANQARRQRIVREAEEVLQEELHSFASWHQSLGTVPMISKFQGRADEIREEELRRWASKLAGLSPQESETVKRMTKRIVAKLLHGPIQHLRTMDNVDDFEKAVRSFENMFKM
jgi:glutamyl-tRNA reductase